MLKKVALSRPQRELVRALGFKKVEQSPAAVVYSRPTGETLSVCREGEADYCVCHTDGSEITERLCEAPRLAYTVGEAVVHITRNDGLRDRGWRS